MNIKHLSKTITANRDEYYTPDVLIHPLVKYLGKDKAILCPFDTKKSGYVKIFTATGHSVDYWHIADGKDFFKLTPDKSITDYIISNPPFSKKLEVFDRLYKLKIPFAMLMGINIFNYHIINDFFIGKEVQLLLFNKRVSFNGNPISFGTGYVCYKFLPQDLIFEALPDANIGKDYKVSGMEKDRGRIDKFFKSFKK
jgi:hypothetical protein